MTAAFPPGLGGSRWAMCVLFAVAFLCVSASIAVSAEEPWDVLSAADTAIRQAGTIELRYRMANAWVLICYDGKTGAFLRATTGVPLTRTIDMRTPSGERFRALSENKEFVLASIPPPDDPRISIEGGLDDLLPSVVTRALNREREALSIRKEPSGEITVEGKFHQGRWTFPAGVFDEKKSPPQPVALRFDASGRLLSIAQPGTDKPEQKFIYPEHEQSPFGFVQRTNSNKRGFELVDAKIYKEPPAAMFDPKQTLQFVREELLRPASVVSLPSLAEVAEKPTLPDAGGQRGSPPATKPLFISAVPTSRWQRASYSFAIAGGALVVIGIAAAMRRRGGV